ncbi:hypothetical protein [Streptomyces flavofungini]|uniref:hypothetical protein n=1 Tax=Streptomyces flavofungini TaxID=68200 RepID=UPI0025B14E5D|nr:hypothetical protein [Streptomyces flavofungini]WJV49589.1 hypothetical protein QUY26_31140 [Streptomyces flavofungini]
MLVVTLLRWLSRCLTASDTRNPADPAPPVGATGPDGGPAADPLDGGEPVPAEPTAPSSQLHDLFREGMKDPAFARELDRLLHSEHQRSLHTQEQQTLSFLAKAGCVSVCLAVVVVALVPAGILAQGVVVRHDIDPWHFVVALAGGCGLLTAAVGWLVRTLRRGRRQESAATTGAGPPADGASADGPAPRAGAG